jgi:hypothetical protein
MLHVIWLKKNEKKNTCHGTFNLISDTLQRISNLTATMLFPGPKKSASARGAGWKNTCKKNYYFPI